MLDKRRATLNSSNSQNLFMKDGTISISTKKVILVTDGIDSEG